MFTRRLAQRPRCSGEADGRRSRREEGQGHQATRKVGRRCRCGDVIGASADAGGGATGKSLPPAHSKSETPTLGFCTGQDRRQLPSANSLRGSETRLCETKSSTFPYASPVVTRDSRLTAEATSRVKHCTFLVGFGAIPKSSFCAFAPKRQGM